MTHRQDEMQAGLAANGRLRLAGSWALHVEDEHGAVRHLDVFASGADAALYKGRRLADDGEYVTVCGPTSSQT